MITYLNRAACIFALALLLVSNDAAAQVQTMGEIVGCLDCEYLCNPGEHIAVEGTDKVGLPHDCTSGQCSAHQRDCGSSSLDPEDLELLRDVLMAPSSVRVAELLRDLKTDAMYYNRNRSVVLVRGCNAGFMAIFPVHASNRDAVLERLGTPSLATAPFLAEVDRD